MPTLPRRAASRPPVHIAHFQLLRQVWYIPQTGEVFVTYEDYLNRYAILSYTLRRIVC